MATVRRLFTPEFRQIFHVFKNPRALTKDNYSYSTIVATKHEAKDNKAKHKTQRSNRFSDMDKFKEFRFKYPEFLPDPTPDMRNALREKLERKDMLDRRRQVTIPEFYVGSVLAVIYSDIHAPGKTNRFVGICIERTGCGLRANFTLRNVIDHQGVEVMYELYDPCIQKIECLRLEKRLDQRLRYLRDAPEEYSTFPFDMEPEYLPEGSTVPVNKIKVPLKPPPYLEKYELQNLQGITNLVVGYKASKRMVKFAKPWEKYDLMKMYRETIPQEEQNAIFADICDELNEMEVKQRKVSRARLVSRKKIK